MHFALWHRMYQNSAWAPKHDLSWRLQQKPSDPKPTPTFHTPYQSWSSGLPSFPRPQSSLHMSNFRQQGFLARHHSWLCVPYSACLAVAKPLNALAIQDRGMDTKERDGRLGEWADNAFFLWRLHLNQSSERCHSATNNSFHICGNDLRVSEEKPMKWNNISRSMLKWCAANQYLKGTLRPHKAPLHTH